MPRLPRLLLPNATYHLFGRGNNRGPIFLDLVDANAYRERFAKCAAELEVPVLAHSEITNHHHGTVDIGEPHALSELMSRVRGPHARLFNARHGRSGPLFEDRFRSLIVESGTYEKNIIRYVSDNPRRHGVVRGFRALAKSPDSSFGALLGLREDPLTDVDRALKVFGDSVTEARENFLAFMFAGRHGPADIGDIVSLNAEREQLLSTEVDLRILGSARFTASIRQQIADLNPGRPVTFRHDLDGLILDVGQKLGVDPAEIACGDRARDVSRARAVVAYLGSAAMRVPHVELARALGVSPQAIALCVQRGRRLVRGARTTFGQLVLAK